ncbi:nuclear transport factor 2 family protein [uncultured Pseudacidovorax sp.]|uniref:nuclear transport factor 2 family protein n=1 Tax=uncultured Pseudacidovorax sp. TaxID=679313 RepID=UPI0025CEAAA9|nr:nuclear transport factor 2 family protein [uncultured Pseudacidovorax sp.]
MNVANSLEDLRARVLAADEARYQALYAQDGAALERLLAQDYLHTHANGKTEDRAAFLATILAGRFRFVDAVRTEQRVRLAGGAIVLSGKTTTTLDVGGATKVMRNAFVTVWVEAADGPLQMLHWQATALPEA